MSLKAFHFIFIVVATLLAFGFAAWSLWNYRLPGGVASDLVVGLVSTAVGLGLIGYEIYFVKKTRNISYL